MLTSILPTCTEESKNSERPRDDLLAVFKENQEPIRNLKKPIIVRVPPNHTAKKGLYYLSQDMNLQPGHLRGFCYTVVNGTVQRYYMKADFEGQKLILKNL